jgi:hypothetical protein
VIPSRGKIRWRCALTVRGETLRRAPIPSFVSPEAAEQVPSGVAQDARNVGTGTTRMLSTCFVDETQLLVTGLP